MILKFDNNGGNELMGYF